jgi:alpha-amylase
MQSIDRIRSVTLALVLVLASVMLAIAQAGFDDDRVMLQGFYWESYRHGHPQKFPTFGSQTWYQIVRENADTVRQGRFDLIWLPPPSFAGEFSAGYNKEYFRLDNSYGSFTEHRAMLEEVLKDGVEPIADIVIHHRDSLMGWADFKNPE